MRYYLVFSAILCVLYLFVTSSLSSNCVPDINCQFPKCRCWDDPSGPGGVKTAVTPQMILLSFEYAVNGSNEKNYTSIFEGILNPNNCSARGTFFVQEEDTSVDVIKSLYQAGHEIGVTTATGKSPKGDNWNGSCTQMKQFLHNAAGLASSDVTGCRAPQLRMGADSQFTEMADAGIAYDSSCVTEEDADFMLWPFTYDFVDSTPSCAFGNGPSHSQKGMWQFIIQTLVFRDDVECATPVDCSSYLRGVNDTANFLYNNFIKHYRSKKTPYILFLEPKWFDVPFQVEGTKKFLHYIRSNFMDTWILTHKQALDWIMNPVTNAGTITYKPWSCNKSTRRG